MHVGSHRITQHSARNRIPYNNTRKGNKMHTEGIPWWSSGVLSLQRAQIQSQVTPAAPCGTGPKKGTEMGKSMLPGESYK